MQTRETHLPAPFHQAVESWRDTFLPDYDHLIANWDRFFPKEPTFQLCAYREVGICNDIECGKDEGKPKYTEAARMAPEQAGHLAGAIRAQASTEFGSIQQHRLTLARAQNEEEQMWILRMMAEELRHGYQMLHLLVEDDWSPITGQSSTDMVEEILSMQTGSHVLGAFNIEFDSFVDNVVFCALIDRVGKYQLSMQRVSAYKPMAESMPQMLREEAFHLASGVVPMRRWVSEAATGGVFVSMETLQKALNKWVPRALEMFGDERGGGTNVRFGLKPMKNAEAQDQYRAEIDKLVDDLNTRYIRARLPELGRVESDRVYKEIREENHVVQGVAPEELLALPHADFFRRRGVPAFRMTGVDGEVFETFADYRAHLARHLPDAYLASRDFKEFLDTQEKVANGELTADEAAKQMPELRRVGGSCPCSKAVRWVAAETPSTNGGTASVSV